MPLGEPERAQHGAQVRDVVAVAGDQLVHAADPVEHRLAAHQDGVERVALGREERIGAPLPEDRAREAGGRLDATVKEAEDGVAVGGCRTAPLHHRGRAVLRHDHRVGVEAPHPLARAAAVDEHQLAPRLPRERADGPLDAVVPAASDDEPEPGRAEVGARHGPHRPGQTLALGVVAHAAQVQVVGADRAARVQDLEAGARRLPGESVVAPGDAEVPVTPELADGRLEDPGILAVREVEVDGGAVGLAIPARQAQQPIVEFVPLEPRERAVEVDVGVGEDHPAAAEPVVGVPERVAVGEAPAVRHDPDLRVTKLGRGVVLEEDVDLVDAGVFAVATQAVRELRRARICTLTIVP